MVATKTALRNRNECESVTCYSLLEIRQSRQKPQLPRKVITRRPVTCVQARSRPQKKYSSVKAAAICTCTDIVLVWLGVTTWNSRVPQSRLFALFALNSYTRLKLWHSRPKLLPSRMNLETFVPWHLPWRQLHLTVKPLLHLNPTTTSSVRLRRTSTN